MKKTMIISYRAQKSFSDAVPFIRIGNKMLKDFGFQIGDKAIVNYSPNKLVIRKIVKTNI